MSEGALSKSGFTDFSTGDATACKAVVRAHMQLVRGIVKRYFRHAFEQEEAVQEVWLHVLRQRSSFDPERADCLDRWIAVLAKRRCIDLVRQTGREPLREEADCNEAIVASAEAPTQTASMESSELDSAVDAFKKRLGPQWRAFFDLHFAEGLSHPDTARALGMTVARSKYMKRVLAARARKNRALMDALGRSRTGSLRQGDGDAP
jgi:RNA polymerase sigma factor (sigma-70 family)